MRIFTQVLMLLDSHSSLYPGDQRVLPRKADAQGTPASGKHSPEGPRTSKNQGEASG